MKDLNAFIEEAGMDARLAKWAHKKISEALEKGRGKGRRGWHDPNQCSTGDLEKRVFEHLDRGRSQYVDAAVLVLMAAWRLEEVPG